MLELYTDGSCSKPNKPSKTGVLLAPGGYSVVMLEDGDKIALFSKHESQTTNNRMELSAIIKAMKMIIEYSVKKGIPDKCIIYSDSQYCIRSINEWLQNWENNNFKNVKNLNLWQEFIQNRDSIKKIGIEMEYIWVKGHANNKYNIKADQLAVAAKQGSEEKYEF